MRALTLALLLLAAPAWAGLNSPPPTGFCETINDPLHEYVAGDKVISMINNFLCLLGLVRDRVVGTIPSQVVCTGITVPAASRLEVLLTLTAPLIGNEVIPTQVVETTVYPRLKAENGILTGTNTVQVPVFNADPDSARTGTLCAQVVRP